MGAGRPDAAWPASRGTARAPRRSGGLYARPVKCGVPAVTLYAFSNENWGRPTAEVAGLMALLAAFLRDEQEELRGRGIRLHALGDGIACRRASVSYWPASKERPPATGA